MSLQAVMNGVADTLPSVNDNNSVHTCSQLMISIDLFA